MNPFSWANGRKPYSAEAANPAPAHDSASAAFTEGARPVPNEVVLEAAMGAEQFVVVLQTPGGGEPPGSILWIHRGPQGFRVIRFDGTRQRDELQRRQYVSSSWTSHAPSWSPTCCAECDDAAEFLFRRRLSWVCKACLARAAK